MLYIPGVVAAVCHGVLLVGGGILNQFAHKWMGFAFVNSIFETPSVNTCVAVVGHMFFPTFTMMCFGFAWVACAYESEAGAYCMVVAPVAYAVLWSLWLCSGLGSSDSWSLLCCYSSKTDQNDTAAKISESQLDPADRKMLKNQQRERKKVIRAVSGSIFASDSAFYEAYGKSPYQQRRALERELEEAAHSPYLIEKLKREANEEVEAEERRQRRIEAIERQRRFNEAFEEYLSRLRAGVAEGPFVFEGAIVPIDDEERAQLEAFRNASL